MAISGVPTTRISDALIQQRLLGQIQSDQLALYRLETQLSTGHRFDTPSDDPVAAQRVMGLQRLLERKTQIKSNLTTSQTYLSATDSSLSRVNSLLTDARAAALGVLGTTYTDEQRRAAAQEIQQTLNQLLDTSNQNFRGRYLFAGSTAAVKPFEVGDGNVIRYSGNEQRISSYANLEMLFDSNLQGNEVFGAISEPVRGSADLDPALNWNTRLADLRGGKGITPGSIAISNGTSTKVIDVSKAESIGDLAALIHGNPPDGSAIHVSVTSRGLVLQLSSGNLSVREVGGGSTASELGIRANGVGTAPLVGGDLDPALRLTTRLDDILGARAQAAVRSGGADNDLIFEANSVGAALNGVQISFFDDHTVTQGHEQVVYDSAGVPPTLRINIASGVTRAQDVVAAVHSANPPVPFTARLDPLDDGGKGEGAIVAGGSPVPTDGGWGVPFDRSSGLQITNGGTTQTVSFDNAQTIEDVLNILNGGGRGLTASINADGTGIDVRTRLSGCDFAIGENGGQTATQLGLRTFTGQTRLTELNFGRGVANATGGDGTDFTITRRDGVSFSIDVDDAANIGDVIDRINNNAANLGSGTPLVARLAATGNGIVLIDDSAGAGTLTVARANMSTAANDLGLIPPGAESVNGTPSGTSQVVNGTDAHLQETDGLFTAMVRLADGLMRNDTQQINRAIEMLDRRATELSFQRAELGSRQQGLDVLASRLDDEDTELRQSMSLDYDVDATEVMMNLTSRQYAYQASLQATAKISSMSLLNYL